MPGPLKLTSDASTFLSDPDATCAFGRTWLYGRCSPQVYGLLLWGRTNREDAVALLAALVGELAETCPTHCSLVDASRVESVDGDAFEVLAGYIKQNNDALATAVTELALVRPAGLTGATIAGFFTVQDAPYPARVFATTADALAWLKQSAHRDWFDRLAAAHASITASDPLRAKLQAAAQADLVNFDLAAAAVALRLSERTVQRRLKELGTTFKAELLTVRLREAKRRMLDSDAPLTRIALDIGLSTPQHFSTVFHDHVGVPPSEWRAQNRNKPTS